MGNSSSKFQASIEKPVLNAFKAFLKLDSAALNESKTNITDENGEEHSFQIDIHFKSQRIIGEIYTCKSKLAPGQVRKVSNDFLKMLSIEKLLKKELNKYFIFALSSIDVQDSNELHNQIVPADEFLCLNPLGSGSWVYKSAKIHDIKILYYFLDEQNSATLRTTQIQQSRRK